jgi:hypothetical protein
VYEVHEIKKKLINCVFCHFIAFNAPFFIAYGAPIFLALQAALINYSVHKLLTGFATATLMALIA